MHHDIINTALHDLSIHIAISQSESAPYLLLANWRFIHQLSLDGSQERTVVSVPDGQITALDYHHRCTMHDTWYILL